MHCAVWFVAACTNVLLLLIDDTWVWTASFLIISFLWLCLFQASSLLPVTSSGPDSTLKCFAKAGKMEPNHLLNGFGPLQPAVAMLWWLPELLLLWRIQNNHWNNSRILFDDDGLWLSLHQQHLECSVTVLNLSHLTNKESNRSFKTLVWSPFLNLCFPSLCLYRDL